MSPSLAHLIRKQGLRHVEVGALCIERRRAGRGFAYFDSKGNRVRDPEILQRIRDVVIPPAWTEVCIADDPRAHIQAVGRDAEGRLQYRYHADWTGIRDSVKAVRLLRFGAALPKIRARMDRDLLRKKLDRRYAQAAAARLIDRALLRSGHRGSEDGGRGAATLLKDDVRLNGTHVHLSFTGKSGKAIEMSIRDPLLLARLRRLKRIGRRRLFVYRDGQNRRRRLSARDLNEYFREAAGRRVTAKDFRTFAASATALAALCSGEATDSQSARKRQVAAAIRETSELLANTPAVARSSYVHPLVVEAYEAEMLGPERLRVTPRKGLSREETALMRLLEEVAA